MNPLLRTPRWRGEDLGIPLPDQAHGASVALPQWHQVIGYEEADPAILNRLQCGYPRFFLHPLVRKLVLAEGFSHSLPFPSSSQADRCVAYLQKKTGGSCGRFSRKGLHFVTVPEEDYPALWSFWQHTGTIISSRLGQWHLEGRKPSGGGPAAKRQIRNLLAGWAGCGSEHVFLFPTGMAAITLAHRMVCELKPGLPTAQWGFPYVDSMKIQEEMGSGLRLFVNGDLQDPNGLSALVIQGKIAAVFTEVPTNPLITRPDLKRLSALLRDRNIPLVVDNTLDSFSTFRSFPEADAVVTSLTKFISGKSDVMGGSLILNPNSPFFKRFAAFCREHYEDLFFDEDALVLAENAKGFQDRCGLMHGNGLALSQYLEDHPAVETLYRQPPESGFGWIFSFVLREPARTTPVFYDQLRCCKGPGLGTEFTLVCPYTMLAHYHELEKVEAMGINRYLIRVSVGMEPKAELIHRFQRALEIKST